eukprot:m.118994 g.118994  ORF g.118994 m.118994 type:complete len:306 (-) comp16450_c0_seq1:152-1069(-)
MPGSTNVVDDPHALGWSTQPRYSRALCGGYQERLAAEAVEGANAVTKAAASSGRAPPTALPSSNDPFVATTSYSTSYSEQSSLAGTRGSLAGTPLPPPPETRHRRPRSRFRLRSGLELEPDEPWMTTTRAAALGGLRLQTAPPAGYDYHNDHGHGGSRHGSEPPQILSLDEHVDREGRLDHMQRESRDSAQILAEDHKLASTYWKNYNAHASRVPNRRWNRHKGVWEPEPVDITPPPTSFANSMRLTASRRSLWTSEKQRESRPATSVTKSEYEYSELDSLPLYQSFGRTQGFSRGLLPDLYHRN